MERSPRLAEGDYTGAVSAAQGELEEREPCVPSPAGYEDGRNSSHETRKRQETLPCTRQDTASTPSLLNRSASFGRESGALSGAAHRNRAAFRSARRHGLSGSLATASAAAAACGGDGWNCIQNTQRQCSMRSRGLHPCARPDARRCTGVASPAGALIRARARTRRSHGATSLGRNRNKGRSAQRTRQHGDV